MFKFKMNVSESDFMAFYTNYLKQKVLRPVSVIVYSIFLLFLLVGPIIVQDYASLSYFGLFVVFVILVYVFFLRSGKKIYKKNVEAFNMTYELSERQIVFSTNEGQATKLWSEFFSLFETNDHLFLYLKNKRGLVFVKDQMSKEAVQFLVEKASKSMLPKNIKRKLK